MESILSSIESSSEEILEDDNILSNNAMNNDNNESSFLSFTNALRQFVLTDDTSATATSSASTAVSSSNNNNKDNTAKWLYNTCSKLPTPLPPLQFTIETLSAINTGKSDESKMQSTLFELFGEGEKSIEILFEIIGKADEIRKNVTVDSLKQVAECVDGNVATNGNIGSSGRNDTQLQHDRLYQLRSDAYEATNLAVAIRTEQQHQQSSGYTSRGTHSITRKSDKEAEKTYKRIIKQAITAVNVAREAGALTESDELFLVSQLPSVANSKSNGNIGHNNNRGGMEQMLRNEEALLYNNNHTRGLDGMSNEQIQSMKYNLAPEGTKQYNDSSTRGLPKGTERIYEKHYEKVIIPAPVREKSLLRSRINLDEVLGEGTDERLAFGGVKSLNPMQSTVFDSAYTSRENLLICAPTGKSSVDMWSYELYLSDKKKLMLTLHIKFSSINQ